MQFDENNELFEEKHENIHEFKGISNQESRGQKMGRSVITLWSKNIYTTDSQKIGYNGIEVPTICAQVSWKII